MQIKEIEIEKIIPYTNNPRKNDDAVDGVAASIKEYGFQQPLVLDKDNVIIIGHTRFKAAKKLGLKTVPCVVADKLSPAKVKALRIADNKLGERSEWDMELLANEFEQLKEFFDEGEEIDLDAIGFDASEIDELIQEDFSYSGDDIADDDYDPDDAEDIEAKVKKGEVWILGDHRLMCGDSTSAEDVKKLVSGEAVDLCLTDPPYGINVVKGLKVGGGGKTHFKGKVGGGKVVDSTYYSPVIGDESTDTAKANFEIIKDISKNQILFGGNYFTDFTTPSRCWLVWDKENNGDFADAELAWTSLDKGVRLYKWLWNGMSRQGDRKAEGIKRVHPTQKPVGLISLILEDFSEPGESVIDCFGGSGSTLIACEATERKCFMLELDPHYCDVIIDRWEKFTGKKAVKDLGLNKG